MSKKMKAIRKQLKYITILGFLFVGIVVYMTGYDRKLIRDERWVAKDGLLHNLIPPMTFQPNVPDRQCTMQERSAHLRDMCHRYYGGNHLDYVLRSNTTRAQRFPFIHNVLVSDEHKVLICLNSKVGSSTFKTIMIRNSEKYEGTPKGYNSWDIVHSWDYLKRHGIIPLYFMNNEEIVERLKTYPLVTVVRHPLVRVFSSYQQKLATGKPPGCQFYQETMGVHILKTLRKNLTDDEMKCGRSVTFAEFVEYMTGQGMFHVMGDEHFETFSHHCHPCFVNYDHIVKLETGETDIEWFTSRFMGTQSNATNEGYHVNKGKNSKSENDGFDTVLEQYANLNASHVEQLLRIYKQDMDLFGYNVDLRNSGLRATCKTETDKGKCC